MNEYKSLSAGDFFVCFDENKNGKKAQKNDVILFVEIDSEEKVHTCRFVTCKSVTWHVFRGQTFLKEQTCQLLSAYSLGKRY